MQLITQKILQLAIFLIDKNSVNNSWILIVIRISIKMELFDASETTARQRNFIKDFVDKFLSCHKIRICPHHGLVQIPSKNSRFRIVIQITPKTQSLHFASLTSHHVKNSSKFVDLFC